MKAPLTPPPNVKAHGPIAPFPPLPEDIRPSPRSQTVAAEIPGASTVEVLVRWQDRVLDRRRFSQERLVHIGSHESCELSLPLLPSSIGRRKLFEIRDGRLHVTLAPGQTARIQARGVVMRTLKASTVEQEIVLNRGETIEIDFGSLFVIHLHHEIIASSIASPTSRAFSWGKLVLFVLGVNIGGALAWWLATSPDSWTASSVGADATPRIGVAALLPMMKNEIETSLEAAPANKPDTSPSGLDQAEASADQTPAEVPANESLAEAPVDDASAEAPAQNAPAAVSSAVTSSNRARKETGNENGATVRETKTQKGQAKNADSEAPTTRRGFFSAMENAFGQSERESESLANEGKSATGRSGEDAVAELNAPRLKNTGSYEAASVGELSLGESHRLEIREVAQANTGLSREGTTVSVPRNESDLSLPKEVDGDAVHSIVMRNTGTMRGCFQRSIRDESEHGKVRVRWKVGARGQVLSASIVNSDFASDELHSCLTRQVRAWDFPVAPEAKTYTVEYPFVFQSR